MYIAQGYRNASVKWKYLLVFGVLLFLVLSSVMFLLLDLDKDIQMEQQIAHKGRNRFLVEMLFSFVVYLFILFFWVKIVHQQSITSLTTVRKKIDGKRISFAFLFWGSITILLIFMDYQLQPENYEWNFQLVPFLTLCLIGFLMIPIQTSFEEYFLRGYLMQGLAVFSKNKWIPLIVSSLIFGVLHSLNPEIEKLGYTFIFYYIATGLFLGIITLMDEGLELALGFHAANNLFTALLLTADWTAFQTESVLKDISEPKLDFYTWIPLIIIYPILLYIFAKKYKWSSWKDKLFGKVTFSQ